MVSAYIDVTKTIGNSIRNCVAPGPVRKLPGIACRAIRNCVPGDRELRGPASGIRIRNCVAYGKEKGNALTETYEQCFTFETMDRNIAVHLTQYGHFMWSLPIWVRTTISTHICTIFYTRVIRG